MESIDKVAKKGDEEQEQLRTHARARTHTISSEVFETKYVIPHWETNLGSIESQE